jgi:7-cyano-7-deazaguanine synthase
MPFENVTKEKMIKKRKAVILLSGGPDSTVLAYLLKREETELILHGLFINYGQESAWREMQASKEVCRRLNIYLEYVNIPGLREMLRHIPGHFYSFGGGSVSFIPFAPAVPITIGVAFAGSIGANNVIISYHRDDSEMDIQFSHVSVLTLNEAVKKVTRRDLQVTAPFLERGLTKADVMKLGAELEVPFEITWSCRLGGDKHCGRCDRCIKRRAAFIEAGLLDPTEYEVEPDITKLSYALTCTSCGYRVRIGPETYEWLALDKSRLRLLNPCRICGKQAWEIVVLPKIQNT